MAVPKRRTSKARKRKRRTHDRAPRIAVQACPQCGDPRRPHRACPSCGHYDESRRVPVREL